MLRRRWAPHRYPIHLKATVSRLLRLGFPPVTVVPGITCIYGPVKMSRWALLAVALVTSIGLAPSAWAAADPSAITTDGTPPLSESITGSSGDTFTVSVSAGGNSIYLVDGTGSVGGVLGLPCSSATNPNIKTYCRVTAGTSESFTILGSGTVGVFKISDDTRIGTLSITVLPGASAPAPAPILQQFGRDQLDDCRSVDKPELDIGGADPGGWGPSWAQWPFEHSGGWVCTRTLTYNTGSNSWGWRDR